MLAERKVEVKVSGDFGKDLPCGRGNKRRGQNGTKMSPEFKDGNLGFGDLIL